MIDNLKSQEELEVKKLKVTKADIVARGTIDKPYYVIVYHEVGKDYDNEGFGSYYLENVFKWREEELEIIDENEQPKTDWIPCSERLPSEAGHYLVTTIGFFQNVVNTVYFDSEMWHSISTVLAWTNLPQPYKKEGEKNE